MSIVPPGLQGPAQELFSGCHPDYKGDWARFNQLKRYTNVFIWNKESGKVLLGFKKRGFGVNLFNGFGGKIEPGETPLEEAGVEADLVHVGTLLYYGEGIPFGQHVEIFSAPTFRGTPTESEEMRPEWFKLPEEFVSDASTAFTEGLLPFPFDKMWEDARLWIPIMLSGKRFVGRADFANVSGAAKSWEETEMAKWWFGTID